MLRDQTACKMQRDVADSLARREKLWGKSEYGVDVGGATDWELLQFCRNAEWRTRSQFFRDGEAAADPFTVIGWCDHADD